MGRAADFVEGPLGGFEMCALHRIICTLGLLAFAAEAWAGSITVRYNVDAGGRNRNPLNGLAALATFESTGNELTILLKNTSTGMPIRFDAPSSLLSSLGMNLPEGMIITSGDIAAIGPGSTGLQAWSTRSNGGSVAEEWGWSNLSGNHAFAEFQQSLTTTRSSRGLTQFGGGRARVGGPYGGIASDPPLFGIPSSQRAVSNSIFFQMTLSSALTQEQLSEVAYGSMIEFGSDAKYLRVAPEPAGLALIGLVAVSLFTHRRRTR